jgi:hypothetical protein
MVPLAEDDIRIEYDELLRSYYIVWNPVAAAGLGSTEKEALEELRAAAHFGIDTAVDIKLSKVSREDKKNGSQS